MERRFGVNASEAASEASIESRGNVYLGQTIEWSTLLQSLRVLLVAEAGAGKTYECEAQADDLFKRGEAAFFLRLETVAATGIRSSLTGEQFKKRFDDWRASSSQIGYFFFDSIDELQLVHGDFRNALKRVHEDLEGALGRATVVVTSRPVDIDRRAFADVLPVPKVAIDEGHGESFVRTALEGPTDDDKDRSPPFREVTLLPFSDDEIAEFARGQGVKNPEKLLEEIRARHAEDFARRPQDLIELCDSWRDHGKIRSHYEQLKSHIKARLRARPKRKEPAELTLDRARTGVQRLALAAILSRRLTIRHSAGADVEGSGDAPLVPDDLLSDFTSSEIETLLQRPIFAEGGYGRVRFHHRSVLEFLAATEIDYLIGSGALAVSAAKRMLFSLSDTHVLLPKPSMRPVAAWVAKMRQELFDAVLKVEPSTLLLYGDPESLSQDQCAQALGAYVKRHGAGQWRGLELPSLQLERLARQPLHQVILEAWSAGIENPEVRQILLQLIAVGRYKQCADLAVSVAENKACEDRERFEALEALVELDDYRVDALIEALASSQLGWGHRIGRWVAQNFYPKNVTDDQFVRLLTAIPRASRRDDFFPSGMAAMLERVSVSRERLESLLPGVLALTRSSVVVDKDVDSLNDRKGRLQASYILRGLSVRLLQDGSRAPDLIDAAVLGFRAAGYSSLDNDRKRKLVELIGELPVQERRAVFESDLACVARLESRRSAQMVLARLMFQGPLQYSMEKDGPWVLRDLANAGTDKARRSLLLRMTTYLARTDVPAEMQPVREAVKDSPALTAELEELIKANVPTRQMREAQEQERKRSERHALKQAGYRAEWTAFWKELAERPALALAPGRVKGTLWKLSTVLSKRSRGRDRVRWDREFIEKSFTGPVTEAVRRSLMAYWRDMKPTLPSERKEKNTYLVVWTYGLMGLYAEAEDPRWTRSISAAEADLAVRYALVELNGLPDWLAALADAHGQVVEQVLGSEIESELKGKGGGGWHSMLLQSLRYGRIEIARVLERRLVLWLRGPGRKLMHGRHSPVAEAKLDQVVRVLLVHGTPETKLWLMELATREVIAAKQGPFLFFWLPVLMRLNPGRGAALLLRALSVLPVERRGVAVTAIGSLFSERRAEGGPKWSAALAPETLLRLNQEINRHVVPAADEQHEDAYSPGPRDNAETGRRLVFDALIQATGAQAYQAKLALSTDPLFAHARDRIAALAHERLAEETDASVISMEELARLFRGNELAPMTTTDMAHLLSDRLDDLQDLMGIDASPKAAWAKVTDENTLRPAIAHQLDMMSKGAYTVDQEGVTVDGKETDIRFRALSRYQATIELKIGEKPRTATELRDTIETQLVKKYMYARNAKTGCLLVTVADPEKRWYHPDTGQPMDRHQLQDMLTEAAQLAQQRAGGEARVMARVLDLTPRLPKEHRPAKGSKQTAKAKASAKTVKGSRAASKAARSGKSGK
ncbi:NACHT domain-containing protein [Ideonella oryzae]|uniref:ATP-binding protein n=1 Tax=Ideonella oryzae TaxID=2937441 RepID=A0ABT1BGJ1_9BURK|nr:hypothetical protein [Ideonella oryzae]MCO5975193.1 hypothetical protein [Ideonella oryzae]